MAVHGNDESKPLACEACGKRFLSNSALACHAKIHAAPEERVAYDCPICGQVFGQIVHLKEHVHKHKGDDGEYKCPQCAKVNSAHSFCCRMQYTRVNFPTSSPPDFRRVLVRA